MVARTAELMGSDHIGIGSDLCQDQPDAVVEWMRSGRWTKQLTGATFPPQPDWFRSNLDFPGLAGGLRQVGFSQEEIAGIMGGNWLRFFERSFAPGGDGGASRQPR
jgi:microsomal dipeptidase-like Zn-dependent dipeptidase